MGMIKEFVEAFDANREAIKAQLATFQGGYAGLVSLVAAFLPEVDPERVTEVDYGDYQGTLVIVIGAEGYQPWRHWAVSIGYGSCSGCDALEQASEERDAGNLEPLFQLALNIVQELRLVGGNDSEAEAELSALRARVESLQVELDLERAITRGKDERHATLEALRARVTELEAMQKALHLGIASDAGIIRKLRARVALVLAGHRVAELEAEASNQAVLMEAVQNSRQELVEKVCALTARLATLEAPPVLPVGHVPERLEVGMVVDVKGEGVFCVHSVDQYDAKAGHLNLYRDRTSLGPYAFQVTLAQPFEVPND